MSTCITKELIELKNRMSEPKGVGGLENNDS